jgi:phage anti-repressor protein
MNANQNSLAPTLNEQKGFYSNLSKTSHEVLIPIFNHELTNEPMVDARELHKKLKVSTQFSNWITRRIEEYDFKEGLEFYPNLAKTSKGSKGGRPTIEYQLTTIMAQELCLLDNSEFGKAIRLYLLQNLKDSQNKHHILDGLAYLVVGGRKLYHYRELQRLLNYSTKSSISNVRRKYADQLFMQGREAYVSEEYALLMIARAEARDVATRTLIVPAVVSNQLNMF